MKQLPLFVYGTFLDLPLVEKVIGHKTEFLRGDKVIDMRKICGTILGAPRRHDMEKPDGRYCTMVPARGFSQFGKILPMSEDDLAKTDKWEDRYLRTTAYLRSGGQAFIYALRPEAHEELRIGA